MYNRVIVKDHRIERTPPAPGSLYRYFQSNSMLPLRPVPTTLFSRQVSRPTLDAPKSKPLLTDPFRLLSGGHKEFHRRHRDLCEDTLLPTVGAGPSTVGSCSSPGPGCPVLSLSGPPTPQPADIDSHPASRVLPFLYLGNGRDAADLQLLRALGATRVLNVTSQLPGYHEERGITYRQIPASDSGHQNLKQYFEEAFDFIGESPLLIRQNLWRNLPTVDNSGCTFSRGNCSV